MSNCKVAYTNYIHAYQNVITFYHSLRHFNRLHDDVVW